MCLQAVAAAVTISSAAAGPPYIAVEPEPVEPGHFEINWFADGAASRKDTSGWAAAADIAYGTAPDFQLHVMGDQVRDAPAGDHPQTEAPATPNSG